MDFARNLRETREIYKTHLLQQGNSFAAKSGYFLIPTIKKKIVPAKCLDIETELDRLYEERKRLYLEYKIIENKIVFGGSPNQHRKSFEDLVEKIEGTQSSIESIHEYYEAGCEERDSSVEGKSAAVSAERSRLRTLKERGDKSEYVKKLAILREIESRPHKNEHSYVVVEAPRVIDHVPRNDDRAPAPEPAEPKRAKKADASPQLSRRDVSAIKDNIKELIKRKLKPKTFEQCASKKRSDPSYMKLEDIHKTIEDQPEIKGSLPSNYKSMTKENLCKHLFT